MTRSIWNEERIRKIGVHMEDEGKDEKKTEKGT